MEQKTKSGTASALGVVYGMGFIGALVYYIQQADGFWPGVWGVLQAIVWPAFLVYHVLTVVSA